MSVEEGAAIRLIPHSASTFASNVDWLCFSLSVTSAFVLAIVLFLMAYFSIKYHHTTSADRGPDAISAHHNAIEITWTAVPFVIFLSSSFGRRGFISECTWRRPGRSKSRSSANSGCGNFSTRTARASSRTFTCRSVSRFG